MHNKIMLDDAYSMHTYDTVHNHKAGAAEEQEACVKKRDRTDKRNRGGREKKG